MIEGPSSLPCVSILSYCTRLLYRFTFRARFIMGCIPRARNANTFSMIVLHEILALIPA
jgi:hypothetical protein